MFEMSFFVCQINNSFIKMCCEGGDVANLLHTLTKKKVKVFIF